MSLEGGHSTLEDDNAILRNPPVRSPRRASVVSPMAIIATLLERLAKLIVDVTVKRRTAPATRDKHWFNQLCLPEISPDLQPFVLPPS